MRKFENTSYTMSETRARRRGKLRLNRLKNISGIRMIGISIKDKKNGKILRMLRRHLQRSEILLP